MGFSVANLDIFAINSFRLSGGNILSSHSDPLLRRPVRLPCSPPAMPDTISAMVGDGAVQLVAGWRRRAVVERWNERSGSKSITATAMVRCDSDQLKAWVTLRRIPRTVSKTGF